MSYWIQEAIEKPGALRAWLKANRHSIRRVTGEDPFDKRGRVKVTTLKKLRKAAKAGRVRLSDTTLRRINLAITLHKLRKRR
ncbi:MAG: hypothetical protein RMI04_08925 [Thermofilaceae archaeon]|nr:hypothetical protein [Thermofilaceae archaeon]